ncbi:MAG: tetratricopeptide repeat protein [Bacteroidia bacterium]|nr:tetratricopeptide repeat protein [Bacteroidia bacterium]
MKSSLYKRLLLIGILIIPYMLAAQDDVAEDDLGNITDEYQEFFFEALKQKGIENYDRAVTALLECIEIDDTNAVLYYELGKNYVALKNYGDAEDALKKAVNKEPDNEWYLDELYGVYIQQKDYNKAIRTVKQLVSYHPDYKEDLAGLYLQMKKYDDALEILDELDKTIGFSTTRDRMRNQIYSATGRSKERIKNLEERVEIDPESETNYLALIYRYSESGDKEKAFETAKKLLEVNPKSQLVHMALYKFYLNDNNAENAIESMKIVLKSNKIKPDAKYKVLNDFIRFVGNNPDYEEDLLKVTSAISETESGKTNTELGEYYLKKGDKKKALEYYEKALNLEPNNFAVLRNVLLLMIDNKDFENVVTRSTEAIENYPAQPVLYLINGVSLNELQRGKEAIEVLETGLDYIIDDNKMESDFYKQLSESFRQENNAAKAQTYAQKAEDLLNKN